jgi:hypothetical protein
MEQFQADFRYNYKLESLKGKKGKTKKVSEEIVVRNFPI